MKNNNDSLTYTGKFILNHNNIDQSSFNINIYLVNKQTIIQITKPFYGNVLNIKFNEENDLIISPKQFSETFYISDEMIKNFKYWLSQCLMSYEMLINEDYNDEYFKFKCITQNQKTSFDINYNRFLLNGFVIRK